MDAGMFPHQMIYNLSCKFWVHHWSSSQLRMLRTLQRKMSRRCLNYLRWFISLWMRSRSSRWLMFCTGFHHLCSIGSLFLEPWPGWYKHHKSMKGLHVFKVTVVLKKILVLLYIWKFLEKTRFSQPDRTLSPYASGRCFIKAAWYHTWLTDNFHVLHELCCLGESLRPKIPVCFLNRQENRESSFSPLASMQISFSICCFSTSSLLGGSHHCCHLEVYSSKT